MKKLKNPFSRVHKINLDRLYLVSAAVFALLAILAGVFMNSKYYQLVVGYMTDNQVSSRLSGETILGQAQQVLFDVNLRWVLVVLLLLSAVLPLLYNTKLKKHHLKAIKAKSLPWRWLDLAVTGSLFAGLVALLVGVSNIVFLKIIMMLVVFAAGSWWLAEREKKLLNPRKGFGNYWLGVALIATYWVVIFSYVINTSIFGMAVLPWYVLAVVAVAFLATLALVTVQYRQYESLTKSWKDYRYIERNHIFINLASKSLIAVLLIVGSIV
jgi:hypothetical protein